MLRFACFFPSWFLVLLYVYVVVLFFMIVLCKSLTNPSQFFLDLPFFSFDEFPLFSGGFRGGVGSFFCFPCFIECVWRACCIQYDGSMMAWHCIVYSAYCVTIQYLCGVVL